MRAGTRGRAKHKKFKYQNRDGSGRQEGRRKKNKEKKNRRAKGRRKKEERRKTLRVVTGFGPRKKCTDPEDVNGVYGFHTGLSDGTELRGFRHCNSSAEVKNL